MCESDPSKIFSQFIKSNFRWWDPEMAHFMHIVWRVHLTILKSRILTQRRKCRQQGDGYSSAGRQSRATQPSNTAALSPTLAPFLAVSAARPDGYAPFYTTTTTTYRCTVATWLSIHGQTNTGTFIQNSTSF